ncbi:hypothetical protein JCM31826_16630 [Thermaurantimonas aggregans]|uniref:Uncharacterized protein n=2 Tax=Thermaurantimonas aggregans TaxID=2173829 RepID=A0A401XMF7_9FLAO|nr:hypothetical protein JCM31826_16630 [Thermaurantimonas aggregans]
MVVAACVMTIACKKEKKDDLISPTQITDINDLKAPDNFSWKTHGDFKFEISGNQVGIVEISHEQTILHRAVVVPGETYKVDLGIPAFMKEVEVTLNGVTKKADLKNPIQKINF